MEKHRTVKKELGKLLGKKMQERSQLNAEIDYIERTIALVDTDEQENPVKAIDDE